MDNLRGLKVAVLITDGFEEAEMVQPRQALTDLGADVRIVSPKSSRVRSWRHTEWGKDYPVDVPLDEARVQSFICSTTVPDLASNTVM